MASSESGARGRANGGRAYWLSSPLFTRSQLAPTAQAQTAPTDLDREARPAAANEECSIRDEGEYWQIVYRGTRIGVRDLKGLLYIQYLLSHPEEKIHVADLAAYGDARDVPAVGLADSTATDLAVVRPTDAGNVLDERATEEYKARILELRADLDEATRWADLERADSIRHEIDFLAAQLSAAYGRNGRARRIGDPMERVRKAVTKCIRNAIERIAKQDASLGRHLQDSIRMGFYCSYSSETTVLWTV